MAAAILPFLRESVFEQNDITAMSMALDDVCQILNLPNGNPAREVIAERIVGETREAQPYSPARPRPGGIARIAHIVLSMSRGTSRHRGTLILGRRDSQPD